MVELCFRGFTTHLQATICATHATTRVHVQADSVQRKSSSSIVGAVDLIFGQSTEPAMLAIVPLGAPVVRSSDVDDDLASLEAFLGDDAAGHVHCK